MKVTKEIVQHAAYFKAGELAVILDSIVNLEPVGDNYLRQLMNMEAKLIASQTFLKALLEQSAKRLNENSNLLDEVA